MHTHIVRLKHFLENVEGMFAPRTCATDTIKTKSIQSFCCGKQLAMLSQSKPLYTILQMVNVSILSINSGFIVGVLQLKLCVKIVKIINVRVCLWHFYGILKETRTELNMQEQTHSYMAVLLYWCMYVCVCVSKCVC